MEQLGFRRTRFYTILYASISRKSTKKIQVSLKSNKKNGYFTRRPMYIGANILLNSY